jgi:hypothetical protein
MASTAAAAKERRKKGATQTQITICAPYKLFGVDVTQIPGLETTALTRFSEIGRDMQH